MQIEPKRIAEIKKRSLDILRENRRHSESFQYTVPSPTTYPYQWMWDSCFHAIVLSHFEPEDAKKEILSLLSKQFDNGMVPHMIYWEKHPEINIEWGHAGTSSITQPPLLAYAVWRIFERDRDRSFLDTVYPALYHHYQYLLRERDPHERHLVGIINPDESGEDNSPRFDTVLNLPPVHTRDENYRRRLELVAENQKCHFDAPFCMKNFFWVKDIPFNAILVENLRVLARIAEVLERSYDAQFFDLESKRIAEAMRSLMLEDNIFWPTYGEHYQKIKVKTWAIFAPLFAKIPTQKEAAALVRDHLNNEKEFKTAFSVPTVSLDEPSFDPAGFWRGPVWMSANWLIYHGLNNYGFAAEAAAIRESSLSLLERSGFREQFNPLTGEGEGAEQFTWGSLIVDMLGDSETASAAKTAPHSMRATT